MAISLSTVEEAFAFLDVIDTVPLIEDVNFVGELGAFHIKIEGLKYHSSVPTELARGLWQLQEELYSAAAYALHGTGDIRKLTNDQREAFQLVFEVSEGSSDFLAQLGKFFERLGDGFSAMDARNKTKCIVIIAILVASAYCVGKGVDAVADVLKDGAKADQIVKVEMEKTRQFETIARAAAGVPEVQKFQNATSDGVKAIVRSASDAENIDVGRKTFDKEEIQEINRRAPRVASVPDVIDLEFRIFKVDVREVGVVKYVLSGPGTGEFVATVDESKFTQDDLTKIMNAAHDREKVRLEVLLVRNKGDIRSAQILQVF